MTTLPSTAQYNADILVCTHCRGTLVPFNDGLSCQCCHATFGREQGFINMIGDPALKTQLVAHNYDAEHGLNEQRRLSNWKKWLNVLQIYECATGKVLEIGAGSGLLTWGLLHHSGFDEVHVSDISPAFLNIIATQHDTARKKAQYYLCDANQLPFVESSMDCVLGNSVLHHFIDYENTLRSAYTVLKPGGKAFFFEPVQNGKAFVALLAQLVGEVDSRAAEPLFTDAQHKTLRHIATHIANQANKRNEKTNVEKLSLLEDKYIFDIRALKRLAKNIGFTRITVENNTPIDPSYWLYVSHQLELAGLERKKLEHYRYLFNTLRGTVSSMMLQFMTTPMVFLVFEK